MVFSHATYEICQRFPGTPIGNAPGKSTLSWRGSNGEAFCDMLELEGGVLSTFTVIPIPDDRILVNYTMESSMDDEVWRTLAFLWGVAMLVVGSLVVAMLAQIAGK